MRLITQFINEYGTTILYTLLTMIFGYLGVVAKRLATKWLNNKTKKWVARECVKFVEQVYKNIHGKEKLDKALKAASQMLAEKEINITQLELRVLIEAALAEFNDAFNKKVTT